MSNKPFALENKNLKKSRTNYFKDRDAFSFHFG